MFLSSLRLFVDRISPRVMNRASQSAVLGLFYSITRFPPAVRAIHILMNGRTPTASERASLCQVVYEVLKHVIPMELIRGDKGRILEGSRLFFGFILDRAMRYKDADDNLVPFLSSLRTLDLRNFETLEPVCAPIMTSIGLVEEGYFNAYREGGI